jgi:2-dehydro-3-deoxy-D-arabinonate dehydratase
VKVYKTASGIIIEASAKFFSVKEDWDTFINDDNLFEKLKDITQSSSPIEKGKELSVCTILAPVGSQELWACGVTYLRSKVGRQEESKNAGGGDFYAKVYEAERPEIFFKATPHRIVGHLGKVNIRKDST